ncbi:xanthine dehydrogenase family protein subunit M [Bradyrhizobium sp. Tv2a-2]|uniref:FAD binding domain-containing protein n=1 Tax=Bradyrhizobium sp. Tv2a-2 TaxID=113395 RepID=UPI000423D0A2|nr:xanthine dehydrogenase family protein subunit M [Bradyrhizobium sp. Tv2a-2]
MKAPAFAYSRATSVNGALELLSAHGENARLLSGGQSLLPAMNLRLICPEIVIDIGDLAELRGIAVRDGIVSIGAMTRHVELLESAQIATSVPLLAEAIRHVAHPAIRNRGTLGGSLAHADPAAELPACMIALDATIVVRSQSAERRIAAVDFFQGIFATALSAKELIVSVELPIAQGASAYFFHEFARRHGDYALAGVAAHATMDGQVLSELRMAFFAIADRPVLAKAAAKLVNVTVTPALISEAAEAFGEELDPPEDQQASADLRRHLARVLFRRCAEELVDFGSVRVIQ